jgi:formylmethanofuran dehydrogenase subunit D
MEFTLITARTMEQGMYIDEKLEENYFKATACCEMNEEDMKTLGVSDGDRVKVKTDFGEVVLVAKRSVLDLPRGVIVVPLGIHANVLIGSDSGTGTPIYKNLKCIAEKTDEDVLSPVEIVEKILKS